MKKFLLVMHLIFFSLVLSFAQTPLSINGRLKLDGRQLVNECGKTVQLRGMSTHGVAFHQNCYRESAVSALAKDWGADILRLAVYTADEGGTAGYLNGNRDFWHGWIDEMVNITEKYGIYVMIDWHILATNPNNNINEARAFFTLMSQRYKNRRHVLYEICNEPTVDWGTIKNYAEQVIPVIRANDPENIIIVGTPRWSSQPTHAANNQISSDKRKNVMYAFHFYAGEHTNNDYMNELKSSAGTIPVFVTEWGTTNADGVSNFNQGNSDTWIGIMNGSNNGNQKISWCNWSFVDKGEASSALTNDACFSGNWNSRTTSGNYIYGKISSSDQFTSCTSAGDDDKDGVPNGSDACAGTAAGATVSANGCPVTADADKDGVIDPKDLCANTLAGTSVNINGCPVADEFSSNVCTGFNNVQGYVKSDFSSDLANFIYETKPSDANPVYSSVISGGQLVVTVTKADPDYKTWAFSFGKDKSGKNQAIDIRAYPVVKFDVNFTKSGTYNANEVLIEAQLEDANGKILNMDALGNLQRVYVALNTNKTVEFNFRNGMRGAATTAACGNKVPCNEKEFDFSKVVRINMWINPQAGGTAKWIRPVFTGTMKVDNFSIGYNSAAANSPECTAIRDDDGDGVKQETDKCQGTPEGTPVDATGCAIITGMSSIVNGSLNIYPVPASDRIHVVQQNLEFSEVLIMDVTGNTVQEISLNNTAEEITLGHLPKGVYMIRLSGSGKSEFLKVVLQ